MNKYLDIAPEVAAALAYTNRTLGFVNAPGLLQKAVAASLEATIDIAEYQARLTGADADIARKRTAAEQELEQLRVQQVAHAKQEAEQILAKAQESARQERTEMMAKASKELVDVAVATAEKIALGADEDPYEQFLRLAERRSAHEQS